MRKYHNKKTVLDGITFDSKKEAERYAELRLLERAGEIRNLRRQVRFQLVPKQYDGKKCVEREVTYIADFVYGQDGKTVVEDTKGVKTKDYIIKRKLMLQKYGIRIKEV
ncbi:MAG: DUF1064 domain-containing protein [Clostridia bacterium]|nr:DUF1064 domain-containing protein [Clostridia bacterium]